jgi:hypothetical protein
VLKPVVELLSQLTPVEWAVIGLATATCLLGALLPTIGNLLGRLFLGEDPLLARWAHARAERKARLIAARNAKREARKAARLAKQARA